VLGFVSWNKNGILLAVYLEPSTMQTINAKHYVALLDKQK
jgi:hypothetical protein